MNLFVSDLDGTLLDKNAELPVYSLNILNDLINSGMNFTVATARTYATVKQILCGLKLNIPIILMNGVLIRDVRKDEYVFSAVIEKSVSDNIISTLHKHGLYAFMYTVTDGEMMTYYEKIATSAMREFCEERKKRYSKPFQQVDNLTQANENSVYFSLLNSKENLQPLFNDLKTLCGVKSVFYRDVYSDDLWYLEVFSSAASKKNAVNFLRKTYGFDYIVCFGDNLNDIPLFEASDKRYAVNNAHPDLKTLADGIIGSNIENGVARFLKTNFRKDI